MSNSKSDPYECRMQDAIARLASLKDGKAAIANLVACGQAAVEPLQAFLFARDVSGIFQPRCQAVEALAALDAKAVLVDFLATSRQFADPVEQAGEDAVTNAVARALTKWPDDSVFSLLLKVAKRKLLAGVVQALGEYCRMEALPVFAAALGDDFCRAAAENACRKLGTPACSCLLQLADYRTPSPDFESDSSRRRRYSALMLFAELYRDGPYLSNLIYPFITDGDPKVSQLACSICLPQVSPDDREQVAARLIRLLANDDWIFRDEIEELLIRYYTLCRSVIERELFQVPPPVDASLRRVVLRACAAMGG